MDVPQSFRNSVPGGSTIEAFAMVEQQAPSVQNFVIFDLISSTFDGSANTVTMQVPRDAFTTVAPNANNQFQAVITLASSPGAGRRRVRRRQLQGCAVEPFNCPLAAGCTPTNSFVRGVANRAYYGIDISVQTPGTMVLAAADGEIVETGAADSWGNYVVLRHSSDSASTLYGFLASPFIVSQGSMVSAGDVIGLSGMSGSANDSLLHLELVPSGLTASTKERVDPVPCILPLTSVPSSAPSQSLEPSASLAPSMAPNGALIRLRHLLVD